jgi:hypothetical protein
MLNERLIHDTAWATALSLMELINPVLRDEERHDAFVEIFDRIHAGIEAYEIQVERLQHRLRPSKN